MRIFLEWEYPLLIVYGECYRELGTARSNEHHCVYIYLVWRCRAVSFGIHRLRLITGQGYGQVLQLIV